MNKVIVAGGRDFYDYDLMRKKLGAWPDHIISGGAIGADRLAEQYAYEQGIPIDICRPDWETYGKAAGPLRNAHMAQLGNILVAFWNGKSKGTRNMIETALKTGLELHVYRYSSEKGAGK